MLNNDVNPKTLSRLELLKLAQTLNVSDADVMTRAELRAAIERASKPEPRLPAQPATWLGVARRLLASVVERGLHLPDAAAVIRGDAPVRPMPSGPPPVATVTLARIYAAQGHLERGIATLDEVLESDPDHDLARELRAQLGAALEAKRREEQQASGAARSRPPHAEPPEKGEPPAQEFELAPEESSPASDLLGAVPPADDVGLAEEFSFDADAAELVGEAAAELESMEPVPETRRESGKPPASTVEAKPEAEAAPVVAAASAAGVGPGVQPIPVPAAEPSPASLPGPASTGVSAPLEPRPAALVLIETGEPGRYLYWELARPSANGNPDPHWISVVTHTPRGAGSERSEKRFPVLRGSGAVRLEGLSPLAVVRAKLSRGDAPDALPLVVASSVWARECTALASAEPRFLPHPKAEPATLAARAAEHLADAASIYC
jgi:hypothetical protein